MAKADLSAMIGAVQESEPAAPAPVAAPAPAAPPAAAPAAQTGSKRKTKPKITYYVEDEETEGRTRAAFYAGRDKYHWRNMSEMLASFALPNIERLEAEFNGGAKFEPRSPGTGPVGRPLE